MKGAYMYSVEELEEIITHKSLCGAKITRTLKENEFSINTNIKVMMGQSGWIKLRIVEIREKDTTQLTELDERVMNAVYTFSLYGVKEISIQQLAGMICGDFSRKNGKGFIERIKASIEKLEKYKIRIEAKEQFVNYSKRKDYKVVFEGYLLDIEEMDGHARNGRDTFVYWIRSPPILLEYASELKQINRIPMEWYKLMPPNLNIEKIGVCEAFLQQLSMRTNSKWKKIRIYLY